MDNRAPSPSMTDPHLSSVAFAPRASIVTLRAVGGTVLLGLAGVVDVLGTVLLVPAAAALLALALRDLLLRPTMHADGVGLTVVDGWRRRHVPWRDVRGLRVVRDRRTSLLEIDLGEPPGGQAGGGALVVLSAARLGVDPDTALLELTRLRPPPPTG